MSSKVCITELSTPWFQVNALAFLPHGSAPLKKEWAIFTHGYTSHKGDCLNWASRLVDSGVPCIIFDQPGHYLGSFNEVNSIEDFKNHVHELFGEAYLRLQSLMEIHEPQRRPILPSTIILGGHSLGAFTAFKALELPIFNEVSKLGIGIGIGIGQRQATHIFETAFYEKTLSIRRQLVSPSLDSKDIFSWLKNEKENMYYFRVMLNSTISDILTMFDNDTMTVIEDIKVETPKGKDELQIDNTLALGNLGRRI